MRDEPRAEHAEAEARVQTTYGGQRDPEPLDWARLISLCKARDVPLWRGRNGDDVAVIITDLDHVADVDPSSLRTGFKDRDWQ